MPRSKSIDLLSVPSDLGANIEGTCEGPKVLRQAFMSHRGFKNQFDFYDKAHIYTPPRNSKQSSPKFEKEILSICRDLRDEVYDTLESDRFPLILGGDHSLAVGSIFGVSRYCIERGLSLGVLWLDAHADMNTPTSSQTGNIHGMPLATVLGQGYNSLLELASGYAFVESKQVALVGVRSVDREEQTILDDSGVTYYTMKDVEKRGASSVSQEIQKNLIDKVDCLHVSFDLDVMDPSLAPSVSTPESGGMFLDQAKEFLGTVALSNKMISMDMVEYNPLYESEGKGLALAQKILDSVFTQELNIKLK